MESIRDLVHADGTIKANDLLRWLREQEASRSEQAEEAYSQGEHGQDALYRARAAQLGTMADHLESKLSQM